jgi:hypothetical protein
MVLLVVLVVAVFFLGLVVLVLLDRGTTVATV